MAFDLPPPDPGVEIVVATRGMSKGIAQSDGPQIVAKSSIRLDDVDFGLQWKNISSASANGEGAAFVSVSRKFGLLRLSGGIAFKFQTGIRGRTDSNAWEFTAGANRKFGRVTARINAVFSPDDLGSARRSLFVEGGPTVQLARGWTVTAAIGHRWRVDGANYTAFNAGIAKVLGPVQLDLRYYDTDRSDSEIYRRRIVGSARVTF